MRWLRYSIPFVQSHWVISDVVLLDIRQSTEEQEIVLSSCNELWSCPSNSAAGDRRTGSRTSAGLVHCARGLKVKSIWELVGIARDTSHTRGIALRGTPSLTRPSSNVKPFNSIRCPVHHASGRSQLYWNRYSKQYQLNIYKMKVTTCLYSIR